MYINTCTCINLDKTETFILFLSVFSPCDFLRPFNHKICKAAFVVAFELSL